MKLQLVLVCVLFPKVLALRCYQCIPELSGTCTDTLDCPDQCISETTAMNFGVIPHETRSKRCAVAEQCLTGSLNLGRMKMTINSKCCSTDLCNSQNVSALPKGSPNGKKCYTCFQNNCSESLDCMGDEDQCITAIGGHGVSIMKGCVSRSICTSHVLGDGIGKDVNCCDGELCNSTNSIKLSLLFMLLPLFSSILFL